MGSIGSSNGDVDGSGTCAGSLDGMEKGSSAVSPVESHIVLEGGVVDSSDNVSHGVSDGVHKNSDVSPGRVPDGVKESFVVWDGT